jgi:Flp pilus assembly protein TadG
VRRRLAARERGAVLVETVVVLPLVLLLVFGIVEWSAAYHDSSVTADAARAGGRIASAQSLDPNMADHASQSVAAALQTLPSNSPQEMWVYKVDQTNSSNSGGYPLNNTQSFTSCSLDCIKYTWNSSTKKWNTPTGTWPLADQNVCTGNFDQVGIYVKIRHDFVTHIFGASITLQDHSVFRFEPTPSASCSST